MKKQLLLAFALFAGAFGFAQEKVSFGIKAGANNSTYKGDAAKSLTGILDYTNNIITTKSKMGYFGGLFVDVPIATGVSIEPGIYYAQKGYEINGAYSIKNIEFLGVDARAALVSNYIDMPLLVKFKADGLQVFAGPQFSYLANANLRTTAGAMGINLFNKTIDVSNQFNRWDAAITGGIGYSFSKNFTISAAYDYGLAKPDKNKAVKANIQTVKLGLSIGF